jgi:hypothetical protein
MGKESGVVMSRWIGAIILSSIFVFSPVAAQVLPAPVLNLPQAAPNGGVAFGFSTGFDYITGKYGAKCALQNFSLTCTSSGTTVFDIPATAMVQIDRLRLDVTVPYVDIEGPGRFSGILGIPVVVAPANNDVHHRSGLGDITVDAAWVLSRDDVIFPQVEIGGVVKLPTAGDGLGTGKTDYGAQVNLYHGLLPGLSVLGSLGYLWIGDINTVQLHSGVRATAGADFKFAGIGAGGLFDYRQSAWQGAPDYLAFTPYLTWRLLGGLGVSVYGVFGLTHSSPSQGGGLRLMI